MIRLNVKDGDTIVVKHLQPISSLGYVRAKIYGKELSETAYQEIIKDVVEGLYSTSNWLHLLLLAPETI